MRTIPPEQIEEFNSLCAEFLKWKLNVHTYIFDASIFTFADSNIFTDELLFHSDWNWIHAVIEAIEKKADWSIECFNCGDKSRDYQMMIPLSNTNAVYKDKKEAVVQAIYSFLKWYKKKSER